MLESFKVFISSTLMIVTVYYFGKIILGNKLKRNNFWKLLLIILLSIAIHTIVYLYTDGIIKTLLLSVVYSLFIKIVFKTSYWKSILMSIIYTLLMIVPDLITLGGTIYIFKVSKDFCYENLTGSIISNICVCSLMTLLTYLLRKPLKTLMNYKLSESKKIVVMSVLAIIFTAIFFYKFATGYKLNQNVLLYLIAMFAFIIILFTLFKQRMDNENVSKKYDELLDVMKNYENDIEEQRTLRHETKNEFATIKCKIQDKEDDKSIIEYIDSVIGDKCKANSTKYSKFKYLPSNGLKGFFYYKFIEAEKKEINVSVNISKQIENSFLKDIDTKDFKDLARIIGVYLDNAIEASSSSKDKKLGIEMYLIKEKIEIIITNTFNNEINLDKLGKESFSTKGKNRGHGLLLVKKILSENDMFEAKNEVRGNIYIQTLKINNNKKNYDE